MRIGTGETDFRATGTHVVKKMRFCQFSLFVDLMHFIDLMLFIDLMPFIDWQLPASITLRCSVIRLVTHSNGDSTTFWKLSGKTFSLVQNGPPTLRNKA